MCWVLEYFQEACGKFEGNCRELWKLHEWKDIILGKNRNQLSILVRQKKTYRRRAEEQRKIQKIGSRAIDSTFTIEEESYDTENRRLTLIKEKDELIQNSKKV